MSTKKVSIIMGVYNDQIFLKDSIQSILDQTYTNFEFIICNDCSTDDSPKIIEEFAKKDARIVFLNNEHNMGLASTLNNCISHATGEYIARMDSDDISMPKRLETQVNFLDAHPEYTVVGTQVEYINNQSVGYRTSSFQTEITTSDVIRRVCVAHPTTMIRKHALEEVNGYTVQKLTRRAEDYDLWCKLVEKGYVLHNLNEVLFRYREDKSSFKKRKYTYRIDEFMIKNYWRKRMNFSCQYFIYALKPLFVGLVPTFVVAKLRKIK